MTGPAPRTPRTPSPRTASGGASKKSASTTSPKTEIAAASPRKTNAPAARDIGLDVRLPKTSCHDPNCPFHGHLKVRGQVMEGIVVSDHMQGTVVVSRTVLHYIPKFERYEKRRSRYLVHSPPCLGIKTGRRVRIAETRSVAKNVSFVVVADLGDARMDVKSEDAAKSARIAPGARAPGSAAGGEGDAQTAQEKLEAATAKGVQ